MHKGAVVLPPVREQKVKSDERREDVPMAPFGCKSRDNGFITLVFLIEANVT